MATPSENQEVGRYPKDLGAPSGNLLSSSMEPVPVSTLAGFDQAQVERLALNLRSYAYAMGAPRKEADEEVAINAARLILPALGISK
jgi:hypothetical protein